MAEVNSQIGIVSPAKLIQVLKRENELFRTSMHQDAHEFLNFCSMKSLIALIAKIDWLHQLSPCLDLRHFQDLHPQAPDGYTTYLKDFLRPRPNALHVKRFHVATSSFGFVD